MNQETSTFLDLKKFQSCTYEVLTLIYLRFALEVKHSEILEQLLTENCCNRKNDVMNQVQMHTVVSSHDVVFLFTWRLYLWLVVYIN